jgi:hypothetical protein
MSETLDARRHSDAEDESSDDDETWALELEEELLTAGDRAHSVRCPRIRPLYRLTFVFVLRSCSVDAAAVKEETRSAAHVRRPNPAAAASVVGIVRIHNAAISTPATSATTITLRQ